jgi:hypothetical protein
LKITSLSRGTARHPSWFCLLLLIFDFHPLLFIPQSNVELSRKKRASPSQSCSPAATLIPIP